MDTGKRLAEIWNESYISSLPSLVILYPVLSIETISLAPSNTYFLV